jgi:cell division protein ZapA (FtsZ GTPase activity inhibitor)
MREIDLEIAGQRLHIRTDEDESYMKGLAAYVDEQMRIIGKGQQRGIASLTIALLAALRIADDYHKAKSVEDGIEATLEGLADAVESCLAESA